MKSFIGICHAQLVYKNMKQRGISISNEITGEVLLSISVDTGLSKKVVSKSIEYLRNRIS
jgi:hypothetical protein